MNLASAWNLPVLFVCKDDGWAITTQSESVTGEDLIERARGLGVQAVEVDGRDVSEVWEACHPAIERARSGGKGVLRLHAEIGHFHRPECLPELHCSPAPPHFLVPRMIATSFFGI